LFIPHVNLMITDSSHGYIIDHQSYEVTRLINDCFPRVPSWLPCWWSVVLLFTVSELEATRLLHLVVKWKKVGEQRDKQ